MKGSHVRALFNPLTLFPFHRPLAGNGMPHRSRHCACSYILETTSVDMQPGMGAGIQANNCDIDGVAGH